MAGSAWLSYRTGRESDWSPMAILKGRESAHVRIQFTRRGAPLGMTLIGAGGMLVLFGILVLVVPQLLEILFAGTAMFFGFVLLGWGWRLRQIEQRRPPGDDQPPWPPPGF